MSDTIIKVEGLGKKYSLKHQQEGRQYKALRDVIADGAKSLARPLMGKRANTPNPSREDFWALKDVNFEIKQGDRVGIIGRNGAGKSTLLKVLSRIVEPTEGRISIKGRVASLLEVGTGFHPELTGRENIYLNGAILGMGKAEIKRKFDEIVAFAEVERFLDTPVKRYSSGMYVRLAFAVAAHLEPEILIVDEVLAVGDAAFQKKCLGKMEDVGKEGRTVLFVSHNMAAIERLCGQGIYLSAGKVGYNGSSKGAISNYLTGGGSFNSSLTERQDRRGNGAVKVISIELEDDSGRSIERVSCGNRVIMKFVYKTADDFDANNLRFGITIKSNLEQPLLNINNEITGDIIEFNSESGEIICTISSLLLLPGVYNLSYAIIQNGCDYIDAISNALELEVIDSDYFGTGKLPASSHGIFLLDAKWSSKSRCLTT